MKPSSRPIRETLARGLAILPWLLAAVLFHLTLFFGLQVVEELPKDEERPSPIAWADRPSPHGEATLSAGSDLPVPASPAPPIPDIPWPQALDDPSILSTALSNDSSTDLGGTSGADVLPDPPHHEREGTGPASGLYGHREGAGRGRAVERYGGNRETESSVEAGLDWLARHQRQDGAWDRIDFGDLCPEDDRCREAANEWNNTDADAAVTGLALLAFLGAGNSHEEGPYAEKVLLAVDYLISRQDGRGAFSRADRMEIYNAAIATLALAECLAMTRDPALKAPVQRGVAFLVATQQPCGGWDYTDDRTTGRCDMSITGWVAMALKSAAESGIRPPDRTVLLLTEFVESMTEPQQWVAYANTGTGTAIDPDTRTVTRRYGPAMLAVGTLIRRLLGYRADSPEVEAQCRSIADEPPDLAKLRGEDETGLHSEYYWYYGTLALFMQQGPLWRTWNSSLLDVVLATQDRSLFGNGMRRHCYGSWPAYSRNWGKWGRSGGKIYATAIYTLILETYYRYDPDFLSRGGGLIEGSMLEAAMSNANPAARRRWVGIAASLKPGVAEAALVRALGDPDGMSRMKAAITLAEWGSPMGVGVLEHAMPYLSGSERTAAEAALARVRAMRFAGRLGKIRGVEKDSGTVLFGTDGAPVYVGEKLGIEGDPVMALRIVRRLEEGAMAIAVVEVQGMRPPQIDDVVVSTVEEGARPEGGRTNGP